MPSNAQAHFNTLIGNVDQLITIHGRIKDGPGRRHEQEALHRAGVVMVIAAWESYVEQVVLEAVDIIGHTGGLAPAGIGHAGIAPPAPTWAQHSFALRKAEISRLAKRFHTPDSTGVRDFFQNTFNFTPLSYWSWNSPRRQWNDEEMRRRLNGWVKIRHCVAHGAQLPIDIPWIQNGQNLARLNLSLLRECRNFFGRIVNQTDAAFGAFITQDYGINAPW